MLGGSQDFRCALQGTQPTFALTLIKPCVWFDIGAFLTILSLLEGQKAKTIVVSVPGVGVAVVWHNEEADCDYSS